MHTYTYARIHAFNPSIHPSMRSYHNRVRWIVLLFFTRRTAGIIATLFTTFRSPRSATLRWVRHFTFFPVLLLFLFWFALLLLLLFLLLSPLFGFFSSSSLSFFFLEMKRSKERYLLGLKIYCARHDSINVFQACQTSLSLSLSLPRLALPAIRQKRKWKRTKERWRERERMPLYLHDYNHVYMIEMKLTYSCIEI